jgi:5-methylcytosine-specific restriction endonuclease McrA
MKEQILKLRNEGKSYREIEKILGCSRSTIAYYCGAGQKEKVQLRNQKRRKSNPLQTKVETFRCPPSLWRKPRKLDEEIKDTNRLFPDKVSRFKRVGKTEKFYHQDVKEKFGENPICYLTGRKIDWNQPRTFTLDHIIAVSKGGDNTLANMGLTCREANKAKDDLSVEELLKLCVDILTHNGYNVAKCV